LEDDLSAVKIWVKWKQASAWESAILGGQ
jgi:hypothetical protein